MSHEGMQSWHILFFFENANELFVNITNVELAERISAAPLFCVCERVRVCLRACVRACDRATMCESTGVLPSQGHKQPCITHHLKVFGSGSSRKSVKNIHKKRND